MTKSLALLILSLVLAATSAPIGAQERLPEAWLLMANPAEGMDTGITIGWHARVPGTFLEIATEPDSAFAAPRRVPGVCDPVTHLDTATGTSHEVLKCRAGVAGLEGGRAYRYRAGRDSFSRPGRFLTAAPGQAFSFLYMSDVHVHNPLPERLRAGVALLELARTLEPDIRFTVLGGDMLAYGSAYDAWNSLAASPLVTTQMTAFTAGNHEFYDHTAKSRGPGYFNTFVHNPANGADGVANTSYFFRYGNALFLSISSEDSWSSDALLEAQKAWFRRVVAENPATFIIAWTHRPFYNGSTSNAGHALTNRTNWSPLFDELGVDLVLSGHDHVYVRTAPTFGGEATSEAGKGTVYLTSTAVGDRYRDADPENPYTNLERILGGETLGTIFTLGPDAIRLRTYDMAGTTVDEAVLPARRRDASDVRRSAWQAGSRPSSRRRSWPQTPSSSRTPPMTFRSGSATAQPSRVRWSPPSTASATASTAPWSSRCAVSRAPRPPGRAADAGSRSQDSSWRPGLLQRPCTIS
jgi:3',5'-cyclic AMP phosphodiesterase CpdA